MEFALVSTLYFKLKWTFKMELMLVLGHGTA